MKMAVIRSFLCAILLLYPSLLLAQNVRFSPKIETIFPFYLGGSAELHIAEQFELGIGAGFAPRPYILTIGAVAAELAGNPAYADVIEDALESNLIVRATGKYVFAHQWFLGMAFSRINVSGTSDIETVLASATGLNYTNLTNLLRLAGLPAEMDLEGEAYVLDASLGRRFPISENVSLQAYIGIAKILTSEVDVSTQLNSFDSSASGQSLLGQTESEIEEILLEYGWAPTIGVSANFYF